MTIGDKLREYRKAKRWSQCKLAKEYGCTRNTIINWENGVRTPRVDALVRLAKILDSSAADIVREIEEQDKEKGRG